MTIHNEDEENSLVLAAEDCDPDTFDKIHTFSAFENKIIRSLVAHGPVLLRGGRGSGKSALLIEADRLLKDNATVFSVYLSLRYLPLLRSTGSDYEQIFCTLLLKAINLKLGQSGIGLISFGLHPDAGQIREQLSSLSVRIKKRVVLIFDDAAHIGRERALTEFFEIFRMLSGSLISCKAAIYPGVTKFGTRFDVFNDATVIDVARDERSSEFAEFFDAVLDARFPALSNKLASSRTLPKRGVAAFLGRTVVGNMRAFVFACNWLGEENRFGLPELRKVLLRLASDYYWPLLEEVAPKLGPYEPLVEPCKEVGEAVFQHAANSGSTSVIIHRDIVQKLSKLFEILEYVGFISRREASRAMKSGGRGPRYCLNLATTLEVWKQAKLTSDLFEDWQEKNMEFSEIHANSNVIKSQLPIILDDADLSVFNLPVDSLAKSNAYPYGLTDGKMDLLKHANYLTIGAVADATDDQLFNIDGIGRKTIARVRAVVNQAVWM